MCAHVCRSNVCCPWGPLGVWTRLPDQDLNSDSHESLRVLNQRGDEISNAGFSHGYFAGLTALICFMPLFFLSRVQTTMEKEVVYLGYQLCMVGTGVWWIVFYWFTWKDLRARPGPPANANPIALCGMGISRLATICRGVCQARSATRYLVIWFLFSEGVGVCGSIGILFAESEVEWGCIPKGLGLWGMAVLNSLCAGLGSQLATRAQARFGCQTKTMLMMTLCVLCLPPVWGLIGMTNNVIGFIHGWEMLIISCLFGGALGPMQGYSRTLFALLIPEGEEANYFGIYQITDKGSSFLGPLVVSVITQATGSMRPALVYPLILILVSIVLLWKFDISRGILENTRRDNARRKNELGAGMICVCVSPCEL